MAARQVAIVELPEQSDRTGSSRYQIQNWADARLQELRLQSHYHRRHRITPPDSQRAVRAGASRFQEPDYPVIWFLRYSPQSLYRSIGLARPSCGFAPEPTTGC